MREDKSIFKIFECHMFWTSIPTRFEDRKRELCFAVE